MPNWRLRRPQATRPRAHFLHIGKTGGSAIKSALESSSDGAYELVLHHHASTLEHVPQGERFFFVLRDPVDRFVSGFYSRQRLGRPRYESPWSSAEDTAFACFDTPDSLACALSSRDDEERWQALDAIRSIQHVRDSYWTWFRDDRYFNSRLGDLLAVLWLPDLTATFPQLCAQLGISPAPPLPDDDVGAHRNPADLDRTLSTQARASLERWYASDQALVDRCRGLPLFMTASE